MRISKTSTKNRMVAKQNKTNLRASAVGSDYTKAQNYIKCAIDALGDLAKCKDVKARDSIANLSVVLLDLQK